MLDRLRGLVKRFLLREKTTKNGQPGRESLFKPKRNDYKPLAHTVSICRCWTTGTAFRQLEPFIQLFKQYHDPGLTLTRRRVT